MSGNAGFLRFIEQIRLILIPLFLQCTWLLPELRARNAGTAEIRVYAELGIMKRIVCAGPRCRNGSNRVHCSWALHIQLIELNRGRGYGG